MTAASAPVTWTPARAKPGHLLAAARLVRLELRRNAMPWLLPVAIGLFWFTTYRKAMAMPPLWYLRAATLQTGGLLSFACPAVGAAAWMGSRDARRRTSDLVTITARPRWSRQLATWAATTCWAMVGYLACVAALYGETARQAPWGGPLWWPVAVVAASLAALAALGFAVGTLIPGRLTAPAAAIGTFFVLALSTQLINGSQSYWQVSPVVAGPWDLGSNPGAATFYHFVPDLPIAQVMFLIGITVAVLGVMALPEGSGRELIRRPAAVIAAAGLLAAGTAVALAGTGRLDAQGMITIPLLHDAANDRPVHYTPVCSRTAIQVCLNPAYASYLPAAVAALEPVINEVAGLPGAPARISQVAVTYRQGAGNGVSVSRGGSLMSGSPPVLQLVLPDQLLGLSLTNSQLVDAVRADAGNTIVTAVAGGGPGATPAQQAVAEALRMSAHVPQLLRVMPGRQPPQAVSLPAPVRLAASRFATMPASARHSWLVKHLAALRAGLITLAQLP